MRTKALVQAIIGAGGFALEDVGVNSEMNELRTHRLKPVGSPGNLKLRSG